MPRLARTNRFKRNFQKKTLEAQARILKALAKLAHDPRYPGLKSKKVQGTDGVWESRVDRANRVTWEYGEGDTIVLRNNCDHDVPAVAP